MALFSMFMPRGVAVGNGEMVCFDRGCAHVVAVTARTRRVVVLDGEELAAGWKSSCHSQRAADVGRKEHADSGPAACGCRGGGGGGRARRCVWWT